MLGQYSRDSCYIIQGIPADGTASLKSNCDNNFCTALLCFVVFDTARRIGHDHVATSQ